MKKYLLMNKNLLLDLAIIGSGLIGVTVCIGMCILTGLFIHWHITPESYQSVQVIVKDSSITLSDAEIGAEIPPPGKIYHKFKIGRTNSGLEKRFYLNDLGRASLYFTFFQFVLGTILSLLMVQEVVRILKSVQDLETFNSRNVKSFRSLGYLCLAMAALNSLLILTTNQVVIRSFSADFTMLGFMLAAFIMAEIFKEGHKLSEQDQLTI
jgi:hypothetical protein